uniref:Uncharacterized protein n=1 Tax=Paramormyrops kingsleyae TaxID=1676925 RepID=A0A3B3SD67_9TELE
GLEGRRQGTHQREFKPYVVRLAKLLRNMEQLLPFFNLLSQVFSSKMGCRSGPAPGPAFSPAYTTKDGKLESQKVFWSRARQAIEEMVEKDFLEGLIKT